MLNKLWGGGDRPSPRAEYMKAYRADMIAKGYRLIKIWVPADQADDYIRAASEARAAMEAQK
jgi:hypothetical protein